MSMSVWRRFLGGWGLLFFCAAIVHQTTGTTGLFDGIPGRTTRQASRSRQGPSSSQLRDALRFFSTRNVNQGDYSQFTPTTPRPEDVNCYVEVPTTTRIGGRCVSLDLSSSARMVCQAGAHMAFTSDCLGMTPTRRGPRRPRGRRNNRRN